MPELPEVEVTRQGIAPFVEHGVLERMIIRQRQLRWPIPIQLPQVIENQPLLSLQRRGKYLLMEFAAGWLLIHLGMSGSLRILSPQVVAEKHDHVDWLFEGASGRYCLRLRDPRRFGAVLWHDRKAGDVLIHPLLQGLGVEPFSAGFAEAHAAALLWQRSRGRVVSVKQFLLAGNVVVGVGNIYASESLFHAGIRPQTPAGKISRVRYAVLAKAVRDVLQAAIAKGGSTLRDFVHSDGSSGYFQLDYFVYDRVGQPCRICQTPIQQLRQGQRSTFFCPACQR